MTDPFILLYGLNDKLFFDCFGAKDQWNCQVESVGERCPFSRLNSFLRRPGLCCVVVEGVKEAIALKEYYESGGLIVYFGILGVFADLEELCEIYELPWTFMAYTKHTLELTEKGKQVLGPDVTFNQYVKSILLKVPSSERLITPVGYYSTLESFMADNCYDPNNEDHVIKGLMEFEEHHKRLGEQVPVALHQANHGGRFGYLGFVNGERDIPKVVQALCLSLAP